MKIKMMNKWLYVITIRIMVLVRKGQNSEGPAGFGSSSGFYEIFTLGILSISHNVTYSVYLFILFQFDRDSKILVSMYICSKKTCQAIFLRKKKLVQSYVAYTYSIVNPRRNYCCLVLERGRSFHAYCVDFIIWKRKPHNVTIYYKACKKLGRIVFFLKIYYYSILILILYDVQNILNSYHNELYNMWNYHKKLNHFIYGKLETFMRHAQK